MIFARIVLCAHPDPCAVHDAIHLVKQDDILLFDLGSPLLLQLCPFGVLNSQNRVSLLPWVRLCLNTLYSYLLEALVVEIQVLLLHLLDDDAVEHRNTSVHW